MVDVRRVLEAISKKDVPYKTVSMIATFPLVDDYGNGKETDVVRVEYSKATVDRINWSNFLTDSLYAIADFENNRRLIR